MPPITRTEFVAAMVKSHDRNAIVNFERLWQAWLAKQGKVVKETEGYV